MNDELKDVFDSMRDTVAEHEKVMALLHDAMGLLHNHAQHKDIEWINDYTEVCARYEEITGDGE